MKKSKRKDGGLRLNFYLGVTSSVSIPYLPEDVSIPESFKETLLTLICTRGSVYPKQSLVFIILLYLVISQHTKSS